MFGLSALSDDAQAVIVKRSEAVRAALYQFHFSVKTLGDAVVAGKAPHTDDLLGPFGEGFGEGDGRFEAVFSQSVNEPEKGADVMAAGDLILGL